MTAKSSQPPAKGTSSKGPTRGAAFHEVKQNTRGTQKNKLSGRKGPQHTEARRSDSAAAMTSGGVRMSRIHTATERMYTMVRATSGHEVRGVKEYNEGGSETAQLREL